MTPAPANPGRGGGRSPRPALSAWPRGSQKLCSNCPGNAREVKRRPFLRAAVCAGGGGRREAARGREGGGGGSLFAKRPKKLFTASAAGLGIMQSQAEAGTLGSSWARYNLCLGNVNITVAFIRKEKKKKAHQKIPLKSFPPSPLRFPGGRRGAVTSQRPGDVLRAAPGLLRARVDSLPRSLVGSPCGHFSFSLCPFAERKMGRARDSRSGRAGGAGGRHIPIVTGMA